MLEHLLHGFRILIASDHTEIVALFAAMIAVCGGTVLRASSVSEALRALDEKPHALLLDTVLPDERVRIAAYAADLGVPLVAITFRAADPKYLPESLRLFNARPLPSTDVYEVCRVLHEATRQAA